MLSNEGGCDICGYMGGCGGSVAWFAPSQSGYGEIIQHWLQKCCILWNFYERLVQFQMKDLAQMFPNDQRRHFIGGEGRSMDHLETFKCTSSSQLRALQRLPVVLINCAGWDSVSRGNLSARPCKGSQSFPFVFSCSGQLKLIVGSEEKIPIINASPARFAHS